MSLLRSEIPEVTSPLARRILSIVYALAPPIPAHRESQDYLANPSYIHALQRAPYVYRQRLLVALYRSDLARQLAAPDTLPLPHDFAAPLERINLMLPERPRSYDQLLRLVIHYLEWFIDPVKRPPGASSLRSDFSTFFGILESDRGAVNRCCHAIHSAELYYYLLDAYGDSESEPEAQPHPVSVLLANRRFPSNE